MDTNINTSDYCKATTSGLITELEAAISLLRTAHSVYTQNARYSDIDTEKEYMLRAASATLGHCASTLRLVADAIQRASTNIDSEATAIKYKRQMLKRGGQNNA